MKYLVFVLLVLSSSCLTVHYTIDEGAVAQDVTRYNQEDFKTGGYTTHTPGPSDIPIDNYIKKILP
jgi:hypothetical protein